MSATGQRAATALLTVGSLCTGYGSLDLAVMAVTGARLTWTAETDRHAVAVLAHHWPGVPNLGDITALDWATVPPVDLVTAGWPCQDISYDGAGADITEGTRSGLWLHIAGGLRHLQPCYVFLENVPAVRTRGLGRVLADLAAGMTRSGRAYALPMPERRTAATAFSSFIWTVSARIWVITGDLVPLAVVAGCGFPGVSPSGFRAVAEPGHPRSR